MGDRVSEDQEGPMGKKRVQVYETPEITVTFDPGV